MESNRIIAEFMQADVNSNGTFELPQHGTLRPNGEFKTEFSISQLKYHSDWNWLMPVVEKIESMGFDVNILKNGTQIIDYSKNIEVVNNVADISFDRKIEHTYQAIVRFVSEISD